jgi:hypothetical protein
MEAVIGASDPKGSLPGIEFVPAYDSESSLS